MNSADRIPAARPGQIPDCNCRSARRAALLIVALGCSSISLSSVELRAQEPRLVRFATFNVSLYGTRAGQVAARLATGDDPQACTLAEIIQRVQPDVLLLNEFDYDDSGALLKSFQSHYLEVPQNQSHSSDGSAKAISFPYHFIAPVNTGIHSGYDLDRNGRITDEPSSRDYGSDCWGFGQYPGQYALVVLSRFPIDLEHGRTFQHFKWRDMPGALLPDDPDTAAPADWYSKEILRHFPLSSKSHWDLPVQIGERTIHLLASHPTPPTFDGPEDRNGRRNHDEIRFWVDYISPEAGNYIYDDSGKRGGLEEAESFVIVGDLNGDPHDGQGTAGITQLLAAPRLAQYPPPSSKGAVQQAKLQGGVNLAHQGDSRHDTLDAADRDGPGNLRLDYVLPSNDLKVVASGVFWPENTDALFKLVGEFPFPSSDHRLVWVDVELGNKGE